jgi:uncharacterized membrane protein
MGPVELGWVIVALVVSRGGKGRMRLLLVGLQDSPRALLAGLLRTVVLCAWMLLSMVIWLILMVILKPVYRDFRAWHNPVLLGCAFVAAIPSLVPFYIAMLAYSLTMFLAADDCGLAPIQAVRKSKQVMAGRKAKLLVLQLPFVILFVLVAVLTNALGHLAPLGPWRRWVLTLVGSIGAVLYMPPITLCTARFFDDLHPLKAPGPPWTPDVPTPLVR